MKIATFNINNAAAGTLLGAKPNVVWLQKLKAADLEFPVAAIVSMAVEVNVAPHRDLGGVNSGLQVGL